MVMIVRDEATDFSDQVCCQALSVPIPFPSVECGLMLAPGRVFFLGPGLNLNKKKPSSLFAYGGILVHLIWHAQGL